MTRRKPPERPLKTREGPSLDNGERTVIRPHEEPSWAVELWNKQNDPYLAENYGVEVRFHGLLMANLGDDGFMISMRNRRGEMEREQAAPKFWRWILSVIFRAPEVVSMPAFEINRLMRLAGRTPLDSLPDYLDFKISYEDFMQLVSAAEARMSALTETPGGADDEA